MRACKEYHFGLLWAVWQGHTRDDALIPLLYHFCSIHVDCCFAAPMYCAVAAGDL